MILWLNPASGISGDMLLGALLDLGAPVDKVRAAIAATGLPDWELTAQPVQAGGIAATRAVVTVADTAKARAAAELVRHVQRAEPPEVAERAAATIRLIAEVEAGLHGTDPDTVHLHELGGLDTVVDVVGVLAAAHELGVTEVVCAPIGMGAGTVPTAHGVLPAPAPATLELLRGAQLRGIDVPGETVTPTGAALLRALGARYQPLPPVRLDRIGRGAGTKVFPGRPNLLQAVLAAPLGVSEQLLLLETTLDDVTGEVLGQLLAELLAEQAADAWLTPAVMKKGRPGHVLHVLCRPELADRLEQLVLARTGSLGLRRGQVERAALAREFTEVEVGGRRVRIKVGPWGGKPEHEDVVRAAGELGLSVRETAALALAAFLG